MALCRLYLGPGQENLTSVHARLHADPVLIQLWNEIKTSLKPVLLIRIIFLRIQIRILKFKMMLLWSKQRHDKIIFHIGTNLMIAIFWCTYKTLLFVFVVRRLENCQIFILNTFLTLWSYFLSLFGVVFSMRKTERKSISCYCALSLSVHGPTCRWEIRGMCCKEV